MSSEQLPFKSNKSNKPNKPSKSSDNKTRTKKERKSKSTTEKENQPNKDTRPHPLRVLLDAVAMAQNRGAYSMNEIGLILEAYNYLSHQFNTFQEQEDTEDE